MSSCHFKGAGTSHRDLTLVILSSYVRFEISKLGIVAFFVLGLVIVGQETSYLLPYCLGGVSAVHGFQSLHVCTCADQGVSVLLLALN